MDVRAWHWNRLPSIFINIAGSPPFLSSSSSRPVIRPSLFLLYFVAFRSIVLSQAGPSYCSFLPEPEAL
jgi:hypothetical protein